MLRKFSSEGTLLELDRWEQSHIGATLGSSEDELDGACASYPCTPDALSGSVRKGELNRDLSISVEDLGGLDKDSGLLRVTNLNESFRAYSDGQLAASAKDSCESVGKCESLPHSASSTMKSSHSSASPKPPHHHRQQAQAKLAAAKEHLKSLFGQGSPHSSHSNLTHAVHRENTASGSARHSTMARIRQWSEMGYRRPRLKRTEMESWAKSFEVLLGSRECRNLQLKALEKITGMEVGLQIFEEFLRSEFSEENLQFHLACEQYRQSSNKFTLRRRAKIISETYIEPSSPREVNLDSKTRELTQELLKAPSHNSLTHAHRRIYFLLEMDCYPRFLHSEIYQTLLQDSY